MNSAWFTTCSAAPENPSTTSAASPRARPSSASPAPMRDDPDVLDAVVGEEPLQVVLPERERDAEHGRDAPPSDEQRPRPSRRAARRRSR